MNDRDHFAAAALTGLVANGDFSVESTPVLAWRMADAMLRFRDSRIAKTTDHDAAPAARGDARECAAPVTAGGTKVGVSATGAESGSTPDAQGFGRSKNSPCQPFDSAPTTDQERFVRLQSAVMNWISEATSIYEPRSDGGRRIMADACMQCWDAFNRIAYPTTNHDAAPAARARTDADTVRTDKAVTGPGEGTGDTPVPYSRTDEKRGDSPTIRDTTPLRKGTPSEGSEPREGTEPVAWAVMEPDGFGIEGTFTDRSDATEWCDGRQQIVPLYRHPQPTLTDAEREAVRRLACACETSTFLRDPVMASTLRGLLDRLA